MYNLFTNLVSDMNVSGEGIANIEWNVYGKIASVTHDANSALPDLEFIYDATGNRIIKKCLYKNPASVITYYYIRDVQGNIMSIYSGTSVPGAQPETFIVEEQPIYGSSRLGTVSTGAEVTDTKTLTGSVYYRQLGQKSYELTDHLGNVRAVISDYIVKLDVNTLKAQLKSINDYYPFGMGMPGRLCNTDHYRFGFNGKEKDNEVNGASTVYDYGFRIYDARIGKFLSIDPLFKSFPWYTPFQFAGNSPIMNIDLEGAEPHPFYYLPQWAKSVYEAGQWVEQKVLTANEVAANTIRIYETVSGQNASTYLKTSAYLNSYMHQFGSYTDANDVSVFTKGKNLDGTNATSLDYSFAAVGIFLPVSGSTLKQGMKGIGGDLLRSVINKVDNISNALDDKHIRAAVGDILGEPIIIAGKKFDHLTEVKNALSGLGNQIEKLNKAIDSNRFSDEVLDEAKRVRSGLQKEKDRLTSIIKNAEESANN